MTRMEIACVLLKVEAHLTLARAAMLVNKNQEFLMEMVEAKKQLGELCGGILNPDETKVYVAK